MIPNRRFIHATLATATICLCLAGCAGLDLDPRQIETETVEIEDGSARVQVTRTGPAPFWTESRLVVEVQIADATSTRTLSSERGTDTAESASLFRRLADKATWLLMGIFGRGAV